MSESLKRIIFNKFVGGIVAVMGFLLWLNSQWDNLSSAWSKLKDMAPLLQPPYEWAKSPLVGLAVMVLGFLWIGLGFWFGPAKNNRRQWHGFFKILNVSFDEMPDDRKDITYKKKLRVVLRNNHSKNLDLLGLNWMPRVNGVSIQFPFEHRFRLEGPNGWEKNSWREESKKITVVPGQAFDLWIGLCQSFSAASLQLQRQSEELGTLLITIGLDNQQKQIEIPL
jgi:hypothetical protein